MLERILVPLDGSVTAETILPHVRRLIRGREAELVLLQAVNPVPVEAYAAVFQPAYDAAQEYLAGIQERSVFKGLPVRTIARGGVPTDVILNAAKEENVSLIAMATHGRTGLARLVMGSTAEQIVRESPVPVYAIRPFWSYELTPPVRTEDQPYAKILLPLDGSPESEAAVPEAMAFARTFGARTILLRVLGLAEGKESKAARKADEQLRLVAQRFEAESLPLHLLIDHGDPEVVIRDIARFHEVDLIAMATHGRTGLRRMTMGSVTERVMRHVKSPMLIVRSGSVEAPPRQEAAASRQAV